MNTISKINRWYFYTLVIATIASILFFYSKLWDGCGIFMRPGGLGILPHMFILFFPINLILALVAKIKSKEEAKRRGLKINIILAVSAFFLIYIMRFFGATCY